MKILHEFWYGNVRPGERVVPKDSDTGKLMALTERNAERLMATLNDEQKELFARFRESATEMQVYSERDNFTIGFQLGLRMTVEAMDDEI